MAHSVFYIDRSCYCNLETSAGIRVVCRRREGRCQDGIFIASFFSRNDCFYFYFAKFRCTGSICECISPILASVGIPPDFVPFAIFRPISGTAALGVTAELIDTHGPDSFIGRLASTMQGSTDTTLYILTV